MMREYALLVALLLLFGCPGQQVVANDTNVSNVSEMPSENMTDVVPQTNITQPAVPVVPPNYTVSLGDTVWVNYTLWINGTVYDTNNATLAQEAGIYNPQRSYEPFMFSAEFNKGIIDGFIINVIGMRVNETVLFEVDPDRAYGPYDPSQVIQVTRYYNRSLYETVPRSYLESNGLNVSVGTAYDTDIGTVFINNTDEENVTLFYILTPGQQFELGGIPQEVVSSNGNLSVTIEYMLDEGKRYILPHPATGMQTNFLVVNKTDDLITLDGNHPLANETLKFEVTLLKVEPFQN